LPAVQPADFGFVAAYGVGVRNQIDTFQGTFTKDIISQTKPNPTVELRLTPEADEDLLHHPACLRPTTQVIYPANVAENTCQASNALAVRLRMM
jgi:hypothetical protein